MAGDARRSGVVIQPPPVARITAVKAAGLP
jgi:hypothetical protein